MPIDLFISCPKESPQKRKDRLASLDDLSPAEERGLLYGDWSGVDDPELHAQRDEIDRLFTNLKNSANNNLVRRKCR